MSDPSTTRPESLVPVSPEPERNPYRKIDEQTERDYGEHYCSKAWDEGFAAGRAAFDAVVAERDRDCETLRKGLARVAAERDAAITAGQKLAEAAGNYAIYATTVKGEYGPLSDAVDEALAAWRAVSGSSEPRKGCSCHQHWPLDSRCPVHGSSEPR